MGKHKTKRFGSLRPNPTGLISENEFESEVELNGGLERNSSTPSAIGNIIEKLQAPESEERTCGCQLLANIVSQPKVIDYLLQENVVKITALLFLDSCLDVRKSALGALRNLSVYGLADVCDVMVSHDVLTPLINLLKQYDSSFIPQKEAMKYDTSTDVLVEAVELLSNLCESSSTAVKCFNKEGLTTVLLPFLKVELDGFSLANAVARCLHVVSENNREVSAVCQQSEIIAELLSIISTPSSGIDGVLHRILVTGILLNLSEVDLTPYYKGIVSTIVDILEMDSFSVISAALEKHNETQKEINYETEKTWSEVNKLLDAQAVSLELLANLCCSDEEWEDMEEQRFSESSDDQTTDASNKSIYMTEDSAGMLCLSSEINSTFLEKCILSKVLLKASPPPEALISKLGTSLCTKTILKKLQDLQTRALLCLSNMVGSMDESSLSQSPSLMAIWTELYRYAASSIGSSDEDFKWAVTSAMRAVIQRLAEIQVSNLSDMSDTDLNFLVSLAKDSKNRETQINIVRIISTIGCILSISIQPHPLLQKIGSILLEVACHNEDLVVISEALDSLFDVFKEDHTDIVVKEIGLVEKLKALQPALKSKISSQRRKLGENLAVVMMAKSNLAGYIKYKMSQK